MIAPELRAELEAALPGAIRFDVPGSKLTSLRVGGPVDALATPPDRAALARLLALCAKHKLRRRVIGRGFNTIVRDEGVDGVLISSPPHMAAALLKLGQKEAARERLKKAPEGSGDYPGRAEAERMMKELG